MKVLLTGMSGTGKSTLISELARRGYRAVDLDVDAWSEFRPVRGPSGEELGPEWLWREDRVQDLLSATDATAVLFVSGCASNQGRFHAQFDHVVLLSVPVPVMVERLATRTTNSFGKHPDELAQIMQDRADVEPLLRRAASLELDTSGTLDHVVASLLRWLKLPDPPSD